MSTTETYSSSSTITASVNSEHRNVDDEFVIMKDNTVLFLSVVVLEWRHVHVELTEVNMFVATHYAKSFNLFRYHQDECKGTCTVHCFGAMRARDLANLLKDKVRNHVGTHTLLTLLTYRTFYTYDVDN